MKDITFKKVLDGQGSFKHLELHQGDQHIIIDFVSGLQNPRTSNWAHLKEVVDVIQQQTKLEVYDTELPFTKSMVTAWQTNLQEKK